MTEWNCKKCTYNNKNAYKFCEICTSPHLYRVDNQSTECDMHTKEEKHNNGKPSRVEERRLVLIGKTGAGKSSTGNTILGGDHHFDSITNGKTNTKTCTRRESMRFGQKIAVVDTPGLYDSVIDDDQVMDEIQKIITLTSPNPHAVILIVQIGRFSKMEKDYVNKITKVLGENMYRSLIVVFTRRDDLERERMSLDNYLDNAPEALKQILIKCEKRYLAIDNMSSREKKESDVQSLLQMIDRLLQKDGGIQNQNAKQQMSYYSSRQERWTENEKLHKDKEKLYNVQHHNTLMTCTDTVNQQSPWIRENIISKNICPTQRPICDHKPIDDLKPRWGHALKETEAQIEKQVEERKKHLLIQQEIDNEIIRLNCQYMMQKQHLEQEREICLGKGHLEGNLESKRKEITVLRRGRTINKNIFLNNDENEGDVTMISQKEDDLKTNKVDEKSQTRGKYKRSPNSLRKMTQSCVVS